MKPKVLHHRRKSVSPGVYLEFLVGVVTGIGAEGVKQVSAVKRTADGQGEAEHELGHGRGKRRRRHLHADGDSPRLEEDKPPPSPSTPTPPALWEDVFERDEVTGAVCNSLAMLGTRGGALLGALRPTLEKLLRGGSRDGSAAAGGGKGQSGGSDGEEQATTASGGGGHGAADRAEEARLVESLQRQRAAMACLLCCWQGLNAEPPSPNQAGDAMHSSAPAAGAPSTSPLSALERPMARACVQAMRVAGRVDAAEKARGARLLRPVLVLVKRWHSLLPLILDSIVEAVASDRETRSAEPLVRCLQAVVCDSWLREHLRRRHLSSLREATETLCKTSDMYPLHGLVVQLRADVELLGGGPSPVP